MVLIEVPVFSNGDLTKEVYEFEFFYNSKYGARLEYKGYSKYERNSVDDLWADEWPEPLSLDEWLKDNLPDWEPDYEGDTPNAYEDYRESTIACGQKTTDGRTMSYATYGGRIPKPPSYVRYEATARLIDVLKGMGRKNKETLRTDSHK